MEELSSSGQLEPPLEQRSDEYYLARQDGSLAFVNEAAARSLGYTVNELGQLSFKAIDPLLGPEFEKHFEQLRQGNLPRVQTIHMTKGGRRVPKELRLVYLEVEDEPYLLAFGGDLRDSRRAEEALLRAQAHLELMVTGSNEVFFYLHDRSHHFTYVSDSVKNVIGYTAEELIGRRYDELLTQEPVNTEVGLLTDRAFESGRRSPSYNAVVRTKDGLRVVLEIVEAPLMGERDLLIHGFARNITARVRAEAAERFLRDRLSRILRTCPDGVVMLEGPTGTISFVNGAAERILHIPAAELTGRRIEEFFESPSLRGVEAGNGAEELKQAILEGRELMGAEVVCKHLDGSQTTLLVNASPLPENDGSLVIAFQDVTEMVELSRLKTELLNVASHELRTPLAPLLLLIQNDQRKLKEGLAVEQADLLRLERQSRRLAQLIDDLLDTSRIDLGRMVLHKESIELGKLVEETVEDLRCQHAGRQILLELPREPQLVRCDPMRVVQVLFNLVDNALRYTPEDKPVEVRLECDSQQARLSVRDHGPGIPPEEQGRIFTRYYAALARQSEKKMGLGLGLYISRAIVELHGGHLRFESVPGQGTVFVMALPRD